MARPPVGRATFPSTACIGPPVEPSSTSIVDPSISARTIRRNRGNDIGRSSLSTARQNSGEFPFDITRFLRVAALVERYLADAVEITVEATSILTRSSAAVAPLLELQRRRPSGLSTETLKAVRTHRITQGRKRGRKAADGRPQEWKPVARVYINKLTRIIVGIFRWGVEEELVPAVVWEVLRAVKGLRKGKDRRVRECKPIKPVPDRDVEAVLKTVSPEIAAMIRLQILTGMRPDEVTAMRPCDLDTAGEIWNYTLGDRSQGGVGHKTDHLEDGGDKYVCLGPKAQEIIKPLLADCPPTEFLFSPTRAVARRYPNGNGGLKPTARYDDSSYCRAVKRACLRAGVPIWTPNRLRHNCATEVRAVFGLEACPSRAGSPQHRNDAGLCRTTNEPQAGGGTEKRLIAEHDNEFSLTE